LRTEYRFDVPFIFLLRPGDSRYPKDLPEVRPQRLDADFRQELMQLVLSVSTVLPLLTR